jgi:hypothetical protein
MLLCSSTGSKLATQTTFVDNYDWKTKHSGSGGTSTTGKQPFSGSGNVEITGHYARIKLPPAMIPLMSSDNNGWFSIENLFINDREITGTVKIKALNKPSLRIDRTNGSISIANSLNDFSGQCDRVDPTRRPF